MFISSLQVAHNKLRLIIKWIKWIIWANSVSCLTDSVNNSESFLLIHMTNYWFICISLFWGLQIDYSVFCATQYFSLILSVLHTNAFTYFFHIFVLPSIFNYMLLYKSNNALSVHRKEMTGFHHIWNEEHYKKWSITLQLPAKIMA